MGGFSMRGCKLLLLLFLLLFLGTLFCYCWAGTQGLPGSIYRRFSRQDRPSSALGEWVGYKEIKTYWKTGKNLNFIRGFCLHSFCCGWRLSVIEILLQESWEAALVFLLIILLLSFHSQHTNLHLKKNVKYSFGSGIILEMCPYFLIRVIRFCLCAESTG